MFKTYEDAVNYLYENLPVFQKIGAAAYKPDLTNTLRLCAALGNPHQKFKSIHVAGTNGKGSTSHMLASVLQTAGYTTGLFTSPHLKKFTERIRVNGVEVEESFVLNFVNRIQNTIAEVKPSFFEITTVMAFDYFAQKGVDVAVIEVGLGGRLDSTNVISPELSVITNIGWDHKDLLGDTLEKIASEKAGIIKSGIPIIVSERQPDVEFVFRDKAERDKAPLFFGSDSYTAQQLEKAGVYYYNIFKQNELLLPQLRLPLQGKYQVKNLPGVFMSVEILQRSGFNISAEALRRGLEHVTSLTNFKGRWQKLSDAPLMVCDTAHNADGVKQVVEQIASQKVRQVHMVWGMVKDKDVDDVLALLPKDAVYYFCQAKIPRAMDADVLCQKAKSFSLEGDVFQDVNDAIRMALTAAGENDLIFIGGSTFVVAEIDGL